MISALSGSPNASALLSLFANPSNSTTSTAATRTASRPPPAPDRPPPGGMGASAESMFAALLNTLTGNSQSATSTGTDSDGDDDGSTTASSSTSTASTASGTTSLADMLTKLVSALDTNGDGQLSADELKAGAQALQGAGGAAHHRHRPDADGDGPGDTSTAATADTSTVTAKGAAKSLYEALFSAVTNEAPNSTSVSIGNDVAQKFLAAVKIAA